MRIKVTERKPAKATPLRNTHEAKWESIMGKKNSFGHKFELEMNELDEMLVGFHRQAKRSLNIIGNSLISRGKSLGEDFMEYFLRVSVERLRATYKLTEIQLRLDTEIVNSEKEFESDLDIHRKSAENEDISKNVETEPAESTEKNDVDESSGNITSQNSDEGNIRIKEETDIKVKKEIVDDDFLITTFDPRPYRINNQCLSKNDEQCSERLSSNSNTKKTKVEQKKVEPKNVEPKEVDPKNVEPKKVEPKKVEPKKVEPKNVEPKEVEPKNVEPKKVEPKKIRPKRVELKVECDVCRLVIAPTRLGRHMLTHSDERPFRCQLCSSSFKRKDYLQKHSMLHTRNNSTNPPRKRRKL